jgi:hypothetical protein
MTESGTTESGTTESGTTESGTTESGVGDVVRLVMSVVGCEIEYHRGAIFGGGVQSGINVTMSVRGARIEFVSSVTINQAIKRAIVVFTDRDLEETRVGNVSLDFEEGDDASIFAKLPYADFSGFWAALRLDRVARLAITVHTGTLNVSSLEILSQGRLFPL